METLCIEDLLAQADGLMYQEKRSHHFALTGGSEQTLALARGNARPLPSRL